jgi:hypothetical protein
VVLLSVSWFAFTAFFYYLAFVTRTVSFGAIIYPPLYAFAATSLLCWPVQWVMLGGLYLFGWLLQTAMLFASIPFLLYFLILRHVEHRLVEWLLSFLHTSHKQAAPQSPVETPKSGATGD